MKKEKVYISKRKHTLDRQIHRDRHIVSIPTLIFDGQSIFLKQALLLSVIGNESKQKVSTSASSLFLLLPFIIPGFLALRCKGKGRQVQILAHTRTQYVCFYTLMIYNHNQILLLKNIPSSALHWKIRNTFVATEIRSNRTVCSVTVTIKYKH